MTAGDNWTNAFSGNPVKPSLVSYEALTVSGNIALVWPLETSEGQPYLASQMDVTATAGGYMIATPNALQGATGQASIVTNVGAYTFTLTDSQGNQLVSIVPGQSWVLSLINNTTVAGTWRAIQLGATTSQAQAGALAGAGLQAVGSQLQTQLDAVYLSANTLLTSAYRANAIVYDGAGIGTFQLDTATNLTDGWFAFIINEGGGALTITTSASQKINGVGSIVLPPGSNGQYYSCLITCDGGNFNAFGLFPTPLAVAQGGTGASNATQALVNLGGTTIGINLFTAPTVAAVLSLLGINQSVLTESTVSGNVTPAINGTAYVCTGLLTINLPLSTTLTKSWVIAVYAQGGAVTIQPQSADKVNNGAAGASYTVPSGGSAFFVTDANGNFWPLFVNNASAGTVTSVGLADNSTSPIMVIGGTPITSAGVLTITLKTQNANLAFMGPTSGGAAQPGFRAIVVPDLPATDTTQSKVIAAKPPFTSGHVLVAADSSGTAQDGGVAVNTRTPVRQAVISAENSGGLPTWLSPGTGLTVNLAATAQQAVLAFANGYSSNGEVDDLGIISADAANYWTGVAASNFTFLSVDRNTGSGALSATQTLAPPQYSPTYNQAAQSVLQFGGASGSTTFLDDFGNSWNPNGGAKVQNTAFKFGTGSLGGSGASNALNGTTDFLTSTSIFSLGGDGWTVRCWANLSSFPASGTGAAMVNGSATGVPSSFGFDLGIFNNGSTSNFYCNLSSTGSTWDITVNTQVTTPAPALGTWHFLELTYDSLAGVYRLYVDGVQGFSIASTAKICAFSKVFVGLFNGYLDKLEILPYCAHPAGTNYTAPSSAPNVAAAGYASDWFDIVNMQMNTVSGASSVVGANPSFNVVERLYVGEAVTGVTSVSSVVNYALQGKYIGPWTNTLPAGPGVVSANDNIGTKLKHGTFQIENITTDAGYAPGEVINNPSTPPGGQNFVYSTIITNERNTTAFPTSASPSFDIMNKLTGGPAVATNANWRYRFLSVRDF